MMIGIETDPSPAAVAGELLSSSYKVVKKAPQFMQQICDILSTPIRCS
jgi:hypothetical protein